MTVETETTTTPAAPTAVPGIQPQGTGPMADGQRRPARRKGEGYGRKYTPRRKVCQFCADKISYVDFKDLSRLRRHLSDRGKIEPRRKTGTCALHQRALATAVKRARHMALLPYTAEHVRISGVHARA
jgi:small subunit ribosomal protein S18